MWKCPSCKTNNEKANKTCSKCSRKRSILWKRFGLAFLIMATAIALLGSIKTNSKGSDETGWRIEDCSEGFKKTVIDFLRDRMEHHVEIRMATNGRADVPRAYKDSVLRSWKDLLKKIDLPKESDLQYNHKIMYGIAIEIAQKELEKQITLRGNTSSSQHYDIYSKNIAVMESTIEQLKELAH